MTYIFVKQFWNIDPPYPALRLIPLYGKQYSEYPLILGDKFNIKVGSNRYCVGTDHETEGWITCIQNQNLMERINLQDGVQREREVSLDFYQCLLCRNDDYYGCRKVCNGDSCKYSSIAAFNKCQPPDTAVYLTHTGGELKVGVSLRTEGRWLDQGSDYSTIIAYAPGLEARKIEQQLNSKLDLKLSIRNLTKFRNFNPEPIEWVKEEMEEKINAALPIIKNILIDTEGFPVTELEVFEYTKYFGKIDFERPIQVVDVVGNVEFGGDIVAFKGPLLVVQQGLYYFGIDTRQLISRSFDFLNRDAKMEGQTSLDEWFNT